VAALRRNRRRSLGAARRVRDDAYRVHDALDQFRDAFHVAVPAVRDLAAAAVAVRRSLRGTDSDLIRLARSLRHDLTGGRRFTG
jgi:hypothetical protein